MRATRRREEKSETRRDDEEREGKETERCERSVECGVAGYRDMDRASCPNQLWSRRRSLLFKAQAWPDQMNRSQQNTTSEVHQTLQDLPGNQTMLADGSGGMTETEPTTGRSCAGRASQ
ncbi:unnamed protein product [Arctogadus glacialis]